MHREGNTTGLPRNHLLIDCARRALLDNKVESVVINSAFTRHATGCTDESPDY